MKNAAMAFATVTLTLAQTPVSEQRPRFEAASIKPTATRDGSFAYDFPPGGRFTGRNVTVHNLLRIAYDLRDYQISGGSGWIVSSGFDIQAEATPAAGNVTREQVRAMLQTMLADRFHLAVHRETRQIPVYDLVVGKAGPRLRPADNAASPRGSMRMGQIVTHKMNMTSLAEILAFDLKQPVRDRTALQGDFAFTLEWARGLGESDAAIPSLPSLFTAVREQLGLKLESAKGPVEVLVIDQLEKPSEN